MKSSPRIFLLTGPSAAGKSTTLDALLAQTNLPLRRFVTTTTRETRPGEKHGEDYWFVSPEEFERDRQAGLFFEYANVYGHSYGSNKRELDRLKQMGDPIIFVIDVQGARTLKKAIPEAVTIYLDAPREQLKARLEARGVAADDLERRLQAMDHEAEYKHEADVVILNDNGDQKKTVEAVEKVIREW